MSHAWRLDLAWPWNRGDGDVSPPIQLSRAIAGRERGRSGYNPLMHKATLPVAIAVLSLCAMGTAQTPTAPVAKKVHTERSINGTVLVDDYAWLRERSSPEVRQYLEAENAYAEAATASEKPLAERLYNETLSHIQQTDTSVPYRSHGYIYYSRTVEGKQYSVLCRKKGSLTAPEEVMLDGNEMAKGEKFFALGAVQVSDNSNLVAYTVDNVGFRQYKLQVKDLRTGATLPDTAERVTSVAWAADNKTLFYTTEDAVTKRSNLAYRHTLGEAAAKDPLSYDEKDERYDVLVGRTRDGRFLFLGAGSHVTTEYRMMASDQPSGEWRLIEPRREGIQYFPDEGDGVLYLRVNDTSHNYRLVTAPLSAPGKDHWTELLAARKDVPVEDIDVFHDFYVVTERVAGLSQLRLVSLRGKALTPIQYPETSYVAGAGVNREFDTRAFRYTYQSPITSASTFEYNLDTGSSTLLKQQLVPNYDKSLYKVERFMMPARDGVAIPVTVTYRKDKFKAGENPLFVYGYGSYGIPMDDYFQPLRLPLLDRGVVYAVSHIRGGGEMGEPWHDAGKMMTKRNTFTDFIDTTEDLLAKGYGKKGRVGIEGGSAGGMLMGAVTNMRPDLFKVVLCEVPFVDVMNTMLDPTLPLTVTEYEEWGNPNEKPAFDYMLTYSPYDNVQAKAYPAILVQTSFDDSQVMYWEPAKYTAKWRALKTDHSPLVFFINMHGGHGGSSGRYDSIRERDRNYAFLLTQLGIDQ
jgi:oligopeptidase B